ncbi:DUF4870 domain-containing protein [Patescibacteria group bacterium]|nr:DUF4870 domain-containing protein [Patescibacteria group bacterium]
MSEAQKVPTFDPKDIEDNKIIAALSYIGILCLIPLLAKKDSKFAQEHGKQGLVLLLAFVANMIISMIPILGWLAGFVIGIALLIFAVIGLIKTLMGEFWEIPLLGQYRNKINL